MRTAWRRARTGLVAGAAAVAPAALAGGAAGCDGDDPPATAAEALDFYTQMTQAGTERLAAVAGFTAPDAVLDARAFTSREIVGRDAQMSTLEQ